MKREKNIVFGVRFQVETIRNLDKVVKRLKSQAAPSERVFISRNRLINRAVEKLLAELSL